MIGLTTQPGQKALTTPGKHSKQGRSKENGGCEICQQQGDKGKSVSREGIQSGAGKEKRGGLRNRLL